MSDETMITGLYVAEFQKALQELIEDFDENVPTCTWGNTLGSSASAIADELVDLILAKSQQTVSDLTAESLVIEVGAGDGSSSWEFARNGCTVHTFEPSTTMRNRAYRQLRDLQNVMLMPYAIGGNDRQATLYQCNEATANLYRVGGAQEGCTVVSMNHWFVYARIAEVDLLFLDCNGSEYEILEQMIECDRLRQVRHLMIVWNGDELERKVAICDELKKTHRLLCDGTQQWHRKDR